MWAIHVHVCDNSLHSPHTLSDGYKSRYPTFRQYASSPCKKFSLQVPRFMQHAQLRGFECYKRFIIPPVLHETRRGQSIGGGGGGGKPKCLRKDVRHRGLIIGRNMINVRGGGGGETIFQWGRAIPQTQVQLQVLVCVGLWRSHACKYQFSLADPFSISKSLREAIGCPA